MPSLPQIVVDKDNDIIMAWGAGAPPSDFLPGTSSAWRNMSNGDVYTLNGSDAWVQLGAAGTGASDWNTMVNKPSTVAGFGITDAFTETAADARYWTQAQADGRFLKLTGGTLTGDLVGTRLTFHDNLIYESFTNGSANLAVNYLGYAGGTSQFRDTTIYDGKSSAIVTFHGSGHLAAFSSDVTAGGSVNAADQIRASGWYTTGSGAAMEMGVSSGTGLLAAYNRTTSAYINMEFAAASYTFANEGGGGAAVVSEVPIDAKSFVSFLVGTTNYGYIKAAQSAGDLITGSATGDLCIRSDNTAIRFSANAGASAQMALSSTALSLLTSIVFSNDTTERFIKSSAFGGAIRLRGNSGAATDRGLWLGIVDNSGVWTPYLAVTSGNVAVSTGFGVSGDATIGGTLDVTGALTEATVPVAKVVVASRDPTISDVYPYGTIWFNTTSA